MLSERNKYAVVAAGTNDMQKSAHNGSLELLHYVLLARPLLKLW